MIARIYQENPIGGINDDPGGLAQGNAYGIHAGEFAAGVEVHNFVLVQFEIDTRRTGWSMSINICRAC